MNSPNADNQPSEQRWKFKRLVQVQIAVALIASCITIIISLQTGKLIEAKSKLENEISKKTTELEQKQLQFDKKIKELADLEEKKRILDAAVPDALKSFGWLSEKVPKEGIDTTIVEQSLKANIELLQAATPEAVSKRNAITIQYFPKDVDKDVEESKFDIALRSLGFRLEKKPPKVKYIPTNAIWFGERVTLEDVKLVAYTLVRAGIQIRAIEFFQVPSGRKDLLIQIGASASVVNDPIFTIEQIRVLKLEDIRGKQRTYGQ